jgi:hypothetical protein
LFEQMNVGIENLVGGRFGRNIFAQMIEANGASLCAQGGAGPENFVERFTGYESPREAVFSCRDARSCWLRWVWSRAKE